MPILQVKSITFPKFPKNRIQVEITNIGNADAESVDWEILITGGLKLFVNESSGSFDSLAINETKVVTMKGRPLLGFGIGIGKLKGIPVITVKVNASNADPTEDSVTAKIFFRRIMPI